MVGICVLHSFAFGFECFFMLPNNYFYLNRLLMAHNYQYINLCEVRLPVDTRCVVYGTL